MDKKVNVLLSAYNGEKYIREQIESILEQSYKNIEIYVRDDGSKDGTLTILKEYEERGLIHLEAGKNVGFVKSFEWLIANGGEADYYAFSDQDDFWFHWNCWIKAHRMFLFCISQIMIIMMAS